MRLYGKRLYRQNNGFSLIELMIAMVLGLILSAGIITVFSSNSRSTKLTTTMTDLQESARFIMNELADDIRMAGFQGCYDTSQGDVNILAKNAPTTNLTKTAVSGSVVKSGSSWKPDSALGASILWQNQHAIPGTHALSLQFGASSVFPLSENVGFGGSPNRSAPIKLKLDANSVFEPFDMKKGEFAIISNCVGADLIRLSSVSHSGNIGIIGHDNSINTSDKLSVDYLSNPNTRFMRFNSNVYYVGDTGARSEDGLMITGLYKQTLPYEADNPPILMVAGIENMRILFGVRSVSGELEFLQPDANTLDVAKIESIRVGLLMVSEKLVTETKDTKNYRLAGELIKPASGSADGLDTYASDRRFRLAFNTTVKVRNRRVN